jgi:hypothetical protein
MSTPAQRAQPVHTFVLRGCVSCHSNPCSCHVSLCFCLDVSCILSRAPLFSSCDCGANSYREIQHYETSVKSIEYQSQKRSYKPHAAVDTGLGGNSRNNSEFGVQAVAAWQVAWSMNSKALHEL